MDILFVCAQNRGRSQMAAGLFNKYSKVGHADSAGTIVSTPGDTLEERAKVSPSAGHVIEIMQEEGVDISKNTQTQITPKMIRKYNKVVVMAEPETIPEWLSSSPKFEYWQIDDPASKQLDHVRITRNNIKQRVLNLIDKR